MADEYQKILLKHIRNCKIPPKPEIKINSLFDLNKLVERLKPTNSKETSLTVEFEKVDTPSGQIIPKLPVTMKSDGESMERRILIDGFDLLKRQQEFKKSARIFEEDVESFGGFLPTIPPESESNISWIDRYVEDHLDGRREGLFVFWDLPEGTYRLEPWSCKLEKVSV